MSGRPAPRKSSLAGSTPVSPAVTTDVAPVPPAAAADGTALPSGETATAPAPAVVTKAKKYPPKVSFYQDPEDTARVRGAILHTMTTEGSRNLSQFINRAVMAEVARLEAKYNNGEPFAPVGAKELPQGRPMGE